MDPRIERSRRAVLDTAYALLYETGVSGLSVEEVARRSGVAKTTIYRHWPTRDALVLDACSRYDDGQVVPDTGSLAGDLTAVLTHVAGQLETAAWASVLPSIVDAAEREPAFAEVHRRLQQRHAAPLRAVLDRAVTRGDLPPDRDLSALVAALLGGLFYRRWFVREPVDEHVVAGLVTLAR